MSITANDDSIETPPILINGWEDLNPPSVLLHNIKKLRMVEPTPIQRLACNVIRNCYVKGAIIILLKVSFGYIFDQFRYF